MLLLAGDADRLAAEISEWSLGHNVAPGCHFVGWVEIYGPEAGKRNTRDLTRQTSKEIDEEISEMRVVDLFCGAGGFSYGMEMARHDVVAAIDYEGRPLAVHAENARRIKSRWTMQALRYAARNASWAGRRRADLTDVLAMAPDIAELNPDVIIGGPPCQPWSKSGRRLGDDDPRAKLTEAYGIIVAAAKPRYFVMENVQEIRDSKVFRRMKLIVRRAGYGLTEIIVNTSDFGTAQNRDRFLCVGALGEADGWFNDYMTEEKSTRPTTVADVLPEFGVELCRKGAKWLAIGGRRAAPANADSKGKGGGGYRLRPADLRLLDKSGDSFKAYWRYPGGRSSGGIRRTDEPAPTIIKSSGGGFGQKYKPRKGDVIDLRLLPVPSLDELSQIAGFPPGWNWNVREKHEEKASGTPRKSLSPIQMLANAVPPPLAAAIGRALAKHARKHIPAVARPDWQIPDAYIEWLTRTGGLAADGMAQQISALREAKRYVGGHCLPDASAEVAAFHKVAAIAHGKLSESHRSMMLNALFSFARWERYTGSLPSERDIKKAMKFSPYLRDHAMPLRADLAALEWDAEYQSLPSDEREEYRQRVITLFQKGDPTPYWTSCAQPEFNYDYLEDEEDSQPIFSIRRRAQERAEHRDRTVVVPQ